MTKKALIKSVELLRMAKIAKEFGVCVETEQDGVIIRVRPFHPSDQSSSGAQEVVSPSPDDWDTPSWSPSTERRSVAVPDDPDIKRYYQRIGFDPKTMDQSDLTRLVAKSEDEWKASIPGTPLIKREMSALAKLAEIGVGVYVRGYDVKGCGEETQDRLEARGFIDRIQGDPTKSGALPNKICLLQQGLDAFRAL